MDESRRIDRTCHAALSRHPRPNVELPSSSNSDIHSFRIPPFEAFAYDISSERYEINL